MVTQSGATARNCSTRFPATAAVAGKSDSIRRRRYEGAAPRSPATCLPQPLACGDASGATTGPMTVSTRAQSFG
jgi:hydroxyethylthiazole kinase-like sugar kinase family protein